MKESKVEIGSRTAKGGFDIEKEVVELFNNWKDNSLPQEWLNVMGYDLSKIENILALQIPVRIKKNDLSIYKMNSVEDYNELQKYKKADVQIQLYIKLNDVIKIENISVKKANRGANFNQVDKRPVSEYQKMWGFNDKIANLLKLFTGEIIEKNNYNYSKTPKRLFLYDFSLLEQEKIIAFFKQNKVRVVADIIKGRGGFSADWVLVCQTEKDSELKNWKLAEINQVLNFLCQGDVKVSPKGSLNIGKITMQRKGGTPDPTSLQFKMNPLDLFLID